MNYLIARPQLKNALWIAAGAGLGGLSGYLIAELVVDRLVWGQPEKIEEDDELHTLTVDSPDGVAKDVLLSEEYQKPPLATLVREYNPNPMEADDPVITLVSKEFVDEHSDLVHLETVYYYEEDQTFAFEGNMELVDEPNDLFIPNVHLHFGEESKCDEIVYIWNGFTGLFYEVVSVKGSYKEEVLGEEAEPPPPPKPKRSRRAAKPKAKPEDEVADELHEDDGKA